MGYACKNCGKAFEPTCHQSRQVFCSTECRIKYHNRKQYAPPEDKCVECGKALEQGSVGANRKFCGDACRISYHYRKQQERKRAERQKPRICPNCGREFVPMWEKGSPRFCSDECRIDWWREYNKVRPDGEKRNTNCAYCGKALKNGNEKYCSRTCYRLGSAYVRGERRCQWCGKLLGPKARTGQKYCSTGCSASARKYEENAGQMKSSITTRKDGVWRKQLAELARGTETEEKKDKRIYLVCGVMRTGSTDTLVNYIRYELKGDPFDGNRFVFCGNGRSQIKWLEWDGSGFCVGARNAESGKYPWPCGRPGNVMEITAEEYLYLCSKSMWEKEAERG